MKRSIKIYALLAALAVVCLAAVGVMSCEEKKEQIKSSEETVLQIASDDVTALSWETETVSLSLHRDGNWFYDEDEEFPVSAEAVDTLLEIFEDFTAAFTIEDVEDYGQYGLDEPVCTIELTVGDESSTVELGSFSTMDSQRYVSIGDGNVYLVSEDPMDLYDISLDDLMENDTLPALDDVRSISVSGPESSEITREDADDEGSVQYLVQSEGESLALDADRVESYVSTVGALSLTNYVNYKVTDDELADYGLDEPELTLTIVYADSDSGDETETLTLSVSRNRDEVAAYEEAVQEAAEEQDADDETEEPTAYVRVGQSSIVYKLSSLEYESLMACTINDLRVRELLTADFAEISRLDITLDGESYTLTSETDDDGVAVWYYEGEELETAALSSALSALSAESAESFTDEQPADTEEISLTVYLGGESGSQTELALYRYDGESCLAVVDGEPFALVPRSQTVDLVEAVNAIVLEKK